MDLPASVQEIADVIGHDQALLLVGKLPRVYAGAKASQKSGGREGTTDKRSWRVCLYVPTVARLGLDHQLVKILGWNDAVKLCREFGNLILYPANCAAIARQFRDASIVNMARQGMKSAAIANVVGMSDRQVRNVLMREIPPEDAGTAANDNAQSQQQARA
jgi:hypothetical protein